MNGFVYWRCSGCGTIEAPQQIEAGDDGRPPEGASCPCYMGPRWKRGVWTPQEPAAPEAQFMRVYLDYADADMRCTCGRELGVSATDHARDETVQCECGRAWRFEVDFKLASAEPKAVMRFENRVRDGRPVGVFELAGVEYEMPADGTIQVGEPPYGRSLAQLIEDRIAIPRPRPQG